MTEIKNEKKMTAREFFTAIQEYDLPAELLDYAVTQVEKLDEKRAKAATKPSKTQIENEPIKQRILEFLSDNEGTKYLQSEIGEALDITANKAGALARQLVNEGVVQVADVKIPKVGTRKAYFVEQVVEVED